MKALQNKLSAEALPAQPLPWALDLSSQAELVYYDITPCKKPWAVTTLWLNLYFIRFVDFCGEKQTFELCNFCVKDACITRKKIIILT